MFTCKLTNKNNQIDNLSYEQTKLIKQYNDTENVYKAKLKQFGLITNNNTNTSENNTINTNKRNLQQFQTQSNNSSNIVNIIHDNNNNNAPASLVTQ